jgi:hypothetical protein
MIVRLSLLAAAAIAASVAAQQPPDIDGELSRLRKELTQVSDQREKNRVERDNEKKDFDEYRDRMTKRMSRVRADIDSVKRSIIENQKKSDSLASLVLAAQQRKRQIDLGKDLLRARIAASCDRLDASAILLPPLVLGQVRSSIALVKSELSAKSIECPEAFSRLSQSASVMREALGSIQAGQEKSPVADLRGTVCRLRVGGILEAIADPKAEQCFVWAGNSAGGVPVWKPADAATAQNIVTATAIREGKHLPAFVSLPFSGVERDGAK